MKLLRFGECGKEKPGVLDSNNDIRDLSPIISDINASCLGNDSIQHIITTNINSLNIVDKSVRLGSCVNVTGKIVCIGYNSHLHTVQMGAKAMNNNEMLLFLKPNSSVSGPNDQIKYTKNMKKLDWEAELGVVIGKAGKYIDKAKAHDHIFGYTCINDLSERYWQFETDDKQFTKGKGFDGFAPIGPYLVTKDEVVNADDLHVRLWVNNELRQDFITSDYINNPESVISYVSQFFTLYPGDIISMGSAPGNAKYWGEDKYLKPGDKLTFEIGNIGRQEQLVIAESSFENAGF